MDELNNSLLCVDSVCYWYPSPSGKITVLDKLNLSVQPGDWLAVTGPSGSGKTTMLNLIALLDYPKSGEINFRDKKISSITPAEATEFRKKNIGMVFQSHYLLPQCTVLENVLLPTIPAKIHVDLAMQRAGELLKMFNLEQRSSHFPWQLSGGECQRVAVARALVNSPALLLADEPTGALDSSNVSGMLEVLKQVNCFGTTIVMVTHSEYAAAAATKRCHLENGKII